MYLPICLRCWFVELSYHQIRRNKNEENTTRTAGSGEVYRQPRYQHEEIPSKSNVCFTATLTAYQSHHNASSLLLKIRSVPPGLPSGVPAKPRGEAKRAGV